MKLKTYIKGKEKYIEVGFWSFLKCTLLVQLVVTGIVYGTMIMVFLILAVAG